MRTPIIRRTRPKTFEDFWNELPSDIQQRWGENFLRDQYPAGSTGTLLKHAEDPMKVVRVLEHAVMNSEPCIRYRPGWQSSVLFFPISTLPTWVADWILLRVLKLKSLPAGVSQQIHD